MLENCLTFEEYEEEEVIDCVSAWRRLFYSEKLVIRWALLGDRFNILRLFSPYSFVILISLLAGNYWFC